MKKLDDIPKQHPFNVPDDYFDKLPGKVQARVQGSTLRSPAIFGHALKYAVAAVTVAVVAFVWFWTSPATQSDSPEAILASIDTSELVAYLNEGDITTDELLDELHLDNEDVNQIEGAVFNLHVNDTDLNYLLDEID
ncbi:MAG: hypothetical protein QM762_20575 [Chryseolinea sp.]